MLENVQAVYREGAFYPVTPCALPENHVVNLRVESAGGLQPPAVTDPEERRRLLRQVTERMRNNPLPANAPKFTREELHEGR